MTEEMSEGKKTFQFISKRFSDDIFLNGFKQ